MMNYDPATLCPTYQANGVIYLYRIVEENGVARAVETPVTVTDSAPYTAVAGGHLGQGLFYAGLTRDDVGGLAYLLSTNNVNYEFLLPGVAGVGANANSFVNGAWRPGVEKITFIPQPTGTLPGTFLPTTNYYTDRYITNGTLQQQQLARIIAQPDFVFSVDDVTLGGPGVPGFTRTGTTNWSNYAAVNGNTNSAGPGIIQPPFHIVFNKLGPSFFSRGPSDENAYGEPGSWGSFNQSTNAPLVYPIPHDTNQLTVRMWLEMGTPFNQPAHSFEWKSTSAAGTQFTLQTSTNLMAWRDLFTIPNDGTVCTYFNYKPASPSRFYRLIQQ